MAEPAAHEPVEGAEASLQRHQGAFSSAGAAVLPETAAVAWRPRIDDARLRRAGRRWTATTLFHAVGFALTGVLLLTLSPWTFPLTLIFLAHAWAIPELYANRGAKVLRLGRRGAADPERVALGLLGDLVGHDARALLTRTGLVVERGHLGAWLIGPVGAVLVRPGGRRLHCFCIKVPAPELPTGDRIAHLLLALREDEAGFATVANGAFSGAPWRLRRRLPHIVRPGLDAAVATAACDGHMSALGRR